MDAQRRAPSLTLTALVVGIVVCFALGLWFLQAMRDQANRSMEAAEAAGATVSLVDRGGKIAAIVGWRARQGARPHTLRLTALTVDGKSPVDEMPRDLPDVAAASERSISLSFPNMAATTSDVHIVSWSLEADGDVMSASQPLKVLPGPQESGPTVPKASSG